MRRLRRLTRAWAPVAVAGLMVMAAAMAVGVTRARAVAMPRAELTGFSCRLALDPGTRSIGATAVMRPLAGTRRMAIRFDLISQTAGGTETVVRGGDLNEYVSPSDPTLGQLPGDVWRLHKLVVPLGAPAVYELRATFRWIGAGGHVLGTASRLGPDCQQRELRPDLVVSSIAVSAIPGQPDEDVYTATIDNTGNSAAGPFSVLFTPGDGSAAQTRVVSTLDAHSRTTLDFTGPLCTSASAPTITADSALQVLDSHRADNALSATCPVTPAG